MHDQSHCSSLAFQDFSHDDQITERYDGLGEAQ